MVRWKKQFGVRFFVPVFVAFVEVVFHLELFGKFDRNAIHAVLFSLAFSFFVLLLSSTGKEIFDRTVRCMALFLLVVYFAVQLVYRQVFDNFLSVKSIMNGAGQVMEFKAVIWEAFCPNAGVIIGMVLLFGLYVLAEVLESRRTKGAPEQIEAAKKWKQRGGIFILAVFLPMVNTFVLMVEENGMGSAYDTKITFHRTEQAMGKLGLWETLKKDVTENILEGFGVSQSQLYGGYIWAEEQLFPKKEVINGNDMPENAEPARTEYITQKELPVRYHEWDIDFEALIGGTGDETIKEMHRYFSGINPTAENEYTGLFAGYNLIYITAESFSDVVIDKERTPALFRMWEEGFQFDNFYTPSWYLSTIDGEYVNGLSQIPVEGDWSLQHAGQQELPMALGNQLAGIGYTCQSYHNHDAYYYDRTVTHPKLGYEFEAADAGLTFSSAYPESDLELMELTVGKYIHKAPFHTYYITMSGHLPYTYAYNSMAVKNRAVTEGMELTENAACYLNANMELEYAVEYLMEELEKAGQLENTLFVIAPDHYPYGLKKSAYDELRDKMREQEGISKLTGEEEDSMEIYRNICLIWSPAMKEMQKISFPVTVKKCVSNLDILPTISNLMGLSYDSRFLAGRDMLSEEMGMVLFKDQSFLTDRVRYHASTGECIWAEGENEDGFYLERCKQIAENRFYYSSLILSQDYMRYVTPPQ